MSHSLYEFDSNVLVRTSYNARLWLVISAEETNNANSKNDSKEKTRRKEQ